MNAAPQPEAAESQPDGVRFTSQLTMGDLLWNAAALGRSSASMIVIGTVATALALVSIAAGFNDPWNVFILLFGLSFLSGLFAVPIVWASARQRPDLMLSTGVVEATPDELTITWSHTTTRQDWSVYRRARETGRTFVLDTGTTALIVSKRAMDTAAIDGFRRLLYRAGLLREDRPMHERHRFVVWVAIGLLIAALLIVGPLLYAQLTLDSRFALG